MARKKKEETAKPSRKRSTPKEELPTEAIVEEETVIVSQPKPARRKLPLIIGSLLILGALAYLASRYFFVAAVNGKMISRLELYNELEKRHGEEALNNIITKTIVFQEAQKRGITVSQEDLDKEIKSIEERFSSQSQNLDDVLKQQGYSREELLEQVRLQLLVEKMVGDKATVTDEEIDKYIKDNAQLLPKDKPAEEQRKEAAENLKHEKVNQESQTLLSELRQKADIKYYLGTSSPAETPTSPQN